MKESGQHANADRSEKRIIMENQALHIKSFKFFGPKQEKFKNT